VNGSRMNRETRQWGSNLISVGINSNDIGILCEPPLRKWPSRFFTSQPVLHVGKKKPKKESSLHKKKALFYFNNPSCLFNSSDFVYLQKPSSKTLQVRGFWSPHNQQVFDFRNSSDRDLHHVPKGVLPLQAAFFHRSHHRSILK